jgi:hypothetical protein
MPTFVNGSIRDKQTGQPIPYATVELTDKNGLYLGFGTAANANGDFSFSTDFFLPNTFLRVSHSAYAPISVEYPVYLPRQTYELGQRYLELDPVIITATKKPNATTNILVWAAVVGVGLYIIQKSK